MSMLGCIMDVTWSSIIYHQQPASPMIDRMNIAWQAVPCVAVFVCSP